MGKKNTNSKNKKPVASAIVAEQVPLNSNKKKPAANAIIAEQEPQTEDKENDVEDNKETLNSKKKKPAANAITAEQEPQTEDNENDVEDNKADHTYELEPATADDWTSLNKLILKLNKQHEDLNKQLEKGQAQQALLARAYKALKENQKDFEAKSATQYKGLTDSLTELTSYMKKDKEESNQGQIVHVFDDKNNVWISERQLVPQKQRIRIDDSVQTLKNCFNVYEFFKDQQGWIMGTCMAIEKVPKLLKEHIQWKQFFHLCIKDEINKMRYCLVTTREYAGTTSECPYMKEYTQPNKLTPVEWETALTTFGAIMDNKKQKGFTPRSRWCSLLYVFHDECRIGYPGKADYDTKMNFMAVLKRIAIVFYQCLFAGIKSVVVEGMNSDNEYLPKTEIVLNVEDYIEVLTKDLFEYCKSRWSNMNQMKRNAKKKIMKMQIKEEKERHDARYDVEDENPYWDDPNNKKVKRINSKDTSPSESSFTSSSAYNSASPSTTDSAASISSSTPHHSVSNGIIYGKSPAARNSDANQYGKSPAARNSDANQYGKSPAARNSDANQYGKSPAARNSDANQYGKSPAAPYKDKLSPPTIISQGTVPLPRTPASNGNNSLKRKHTEYQNEANHESAMDSLSSKDDAYKGRKYSPFKYSPTKEYYDQINSLVPNTSLNLDKKNVLAKRLVLLAERNHNAASIDLSNIEDALHRNCTSSTGSNRHMMNYRNEILTHLHKCVYELKDARETDMRLSKEIRIASKTAPTPDYLDRKQFYKQYGTAEDQAIFEDESECSEYNTDDAEKDEDASAEDDAEDENAPAEEKFK